MAKLCSDVGAGTVKADSHVAVVAENSIANRPIVLAQPTAEFIAGQPLAFRPSVIDVIDGQKRQTRFSAARALTAIMKKCVAPLGDVAIKHLLATRITQQSVGTRMFAAHRTATACNAFLTGTLPATQHFLSATIVRAASTVKAVLTALLSGRGFARVAYMALCRIAARLSNGGHNYSLSHSIIGGPTW